MRNFSRPLIWLLLAGRVAQADMVVTTPSVGYQKLTARGGTDSRLSIPLVKRAALTARVLTVSADTLTLSTDGLIAGSLAPNPSGSYYAQFTTGNLAGLCLPILNNSTDSISVEANEDLSDHSLGPIKTDDADESGDLVRIRAFWSVADLTSSAWTAVASLPGGPYIGGDALLLPDNVSIGTEKKPLGVVYYVYGDGWRATSNPTLDAGTVRLPPGRAFIVRRHDLLPNEFILVGDVSPDPFRLFIPSLEAGEEIDVSVALAGCSPRTLANSGLFSVGERTALTSSVGLLEPRDLLLRYSTTRMGFGLPPESRYHVFEAHWFEVTTPAAGQVLSPGEGYILRLRGQRPASWWLQTAEN